MNNKVFFKPNSDEKTFKYALVHFEDDNSFLAVSESCEGSPTLKSLEGIESNSDEAEKILIEIDNDIFSTKSGTDTSRQPWKHCLNAGVPLALRIIRCKYKENAD